MTGWNIEPGTWRMTWGIDHDGDDRIDGKAQVREFAFEKSAPVEVVFPPGQTVVMEFELLEKGTPVELRADLGIGRGDLRVQGDVVEVTVHSLGHAGTAPGHAVLEDARGRELARAPVPAMAAPLDLEPKTTVVSLPLGGHAPEGLYVRVAMDGNAEEITRLNNRRALD